MHIFPKTQNVHCKVHHKKYCAYKYWSTADKLVAIIQLVACAKSAQF